MTKLQKAERASERAMRLSDRAFRIARLERHIEDAVRSGDDELAAMFRRELVRTKGAKL